MARQGLVLEGLPRGGEQRWGSEDAQLAWGPCSGSQEPGVGPASWLCPDQAGQRVSQAQHSRLSRRGAEAFLAGDQMRVIGVELSLQRAAH